MLKNFLKKFQKIFGVFKTPYCPHHQLSTRKGGREFTKQCAFTVHNEACDAHRELHRHKAREVTFSRLPLDEARQLHTFDEYFKRETAETRL